jgi:glutathione peroxidase
MKNQQTIHDFEIKALNSEEVIKLSDFKGKYILIVNVASKCGFTPQYKQLQSMYEEKNKAMEVIGFPCNQFLWQENGTEDKIAQFCSMEYGVTFPITTKIKVKGSGKHPIYDWLTDKRRNGKQDAKVSWNFNKFLIDPEGNLVKHFGSNVMPNSKEILTYIEEHEAKMNEE